MSNDLDIWLENNNYYNRTTITSSPSHLIYTGYKGGKLFIPRNKEYDFLCKYAKELEKGTKLYYVETRPRTFKFMIDIDISDDHYWNNEEISKLISHIQKTVYDFFENNQYTICCISPLKMKNDDIHTGIHLIWPNLFVNSDTALCIRRGIIQKLNEDKEIFKLKKTWEEIIDETIYTRNGYRMVGSDKMIKDTKTSVKIPENRPIELLFVMDSEGNLSETYYNRIKKDTKSLILETSIRYVIDAYLEHGMNISKLPRWLKEDDFKRRAGVRTSEGSVVSSKEHFILEKFMKKYLPTQYNGTIKAITRYPKEDNYPHALLIKTNSRYCMNIGRNHNSCGIYFYATPEGMVQKCLCTCNKLENRKTGLCMDFTSGLYHFDEDTRTILFPELDVNLFEETAKKKEKVKKQQKMKKETKYVPETKANSIKHQKELCDKLLGDIIGEYIK